MTEEKIGCGKNTETKLYGKDIELFCGDIILGKIVLCPSCQKKQDEIFGETLDD